MITMEQTSVLGSGVDRETLRDIGERVASISARDTYRPAESPAGQEAGYFQRASQSKIVRYGAVALLAFGIGMAGKDNFAQSYRAAAKTAKQGVGYVAAKVFSVIPQDQRNEVIRDNVKDLSPAELAEQMKKLQVKK